MNLIWGKLVIEQSNRMKNVLLITRRSVEHGTRALMALG